MGLSTSGCEKLKIWRAIWAYGLLSLQEREVYQAKLPKLEQAMGVFTKIILTSRWLKVLIYTDLIVVQAIYQFGQSF